MWNALSLLCAVFLPVSLVFSLWLYRAAKTIHVDDYRVISCGCLTVTRLSLVTKLSYLWGISMPQLTRGRFLFFPATTGTGGDDDGTLLAGGDSKKKLTKNTSAPAIVEATAAGATRQAPRFHLDGLSRADMLAYVARHGGCSSSTSALSNKTLVVSFSGGATNKIGMPRTEFMRTINSAGPAAAACDKLFVLDPTGMSFYTKDLLSFCETLKAVTSSYARVVLLGNCMGGTGAILCAPLLNLSADSSVVVFNPVVDPSLCGRPEQVRSDSRSARSTLVWR